MKTAEQEINEVKETARILQENMEKLKIKVTSQWDTVNGPYLSGYVEFGAFATMNGIEGYIVDHKKRGGKVTFQPIGCYGNDNITIIGDTVLI